MLEALTACREQLEADVSRGEVAAESVQRDRRREYVLQHDVYVPFVETLTDFDYYVLDKAEAVLRAQRVLDTRQYVDVYEMQAWTEFVGNMKLIILRPG